jgi:hypothetical protein
MRTTPKAVYSPTEIESKDLLEPDRLKAIKNVHAYQAEMKVWRDIKVKGKPFK